MLEGLEKEAREAKKGLWVIQRPSHRGSTEKQDEGNHPTCQTSCHWRVNLREVALLAVLIRETSPITQPSG